MSDSLFPQTIDVVKTRCHAIGIELEIGKIDDFDWDRASEYAGILVQNPDNFGSVTDFTELGAMCKENKVIFTIIADILSLNIIKPPSEMNADIACGSAQRMGIPMAFGGPHPGYFATSN